MHLFSRKIGKGHPILILHGLLGMSDNWLTIGKNLALEGYAVHLLDLRNHGQSPHSNTHSYPDMCGDLLDYLEQEKLNEVSIIGHSMGGKAAMFFGLLHPEKVKTLIIVDIAPSDYRRSNKILHANLIASLLEIDLSSHENKRTIMEEIEERLNNRTLALFLGKNIARDIHDNFSWKLNLPVLQNYLPTIYAGLDELKIYAPSPVRTLFIKGNNSDYIRPEHEPEIRKYYPWSNVVGIDNAGHWVHADQPVKFLEALSVFLGT